MPCDILCFSFEFGFAFCFFLVGYLVSDTPLKGPCLMRGVGAGGRGWSWVGRGAVLGGWAH